MIANRVFAGFAEANEREVIVDVDAFIRRVLLFDEYIVQTIRLADIAQLVVNFGVEGLIELLESGIVSIHCDALTMAQTGQSVIYENQTGTVLPLGSYSFHNINASDRRWYLSDCLKNIHTYVPNLKQAIRLKKAVLGALTPTETKTYLYLGFDDALKQNRTIIKTALERTLPDFGYKRTDSGDLDIKVEGINQNDYRVESNLATLYGMQPEDAHKIIERSLLTVSGFYQRLGYMRNYDAIAWFHHDDMPLLQSELNLFKVETESNTQENRFTRILDIKGLPHISNSQQIDVGKLLKVRESKECREFREWLRTTDSLTEEEIAAMVNSLRAKVLTAVGGNAGKVVRFVVSAGLGAVLNPIAGVAIDGVDSFVLDAIIKKPGPVSFINNALPKLYKN